MVPTPPYRAKDFSLIKLDGWFHCFYIKRDMSAPYDSTERELGHAVSRDFYNWTQLPPVLQVRPDHWDNAKVWSPDLHEIDGVFYMFYTGVTNSPGFAFHQRIGLATSTDLFNWNRLDQPVFACDQVPWTHCDRLTYSGGEFRDPFVMPNPAGGWLMYYTAAPSSDPTTFVAGTGASGGDFTQWSGLGPLEITHWEWSGSTVVESVHLFPHGGLYYLLFTGNGSQPLRIATGPDPLGAPETWTFRGTLGAMLGVDTGQWFASEYFQDGTHEYLAFVNFDRLDFREIHWNSDWTFTLAQPPLYHVQRLTWSEPEVQAGDVVRLRFDVVNALNTGSRLEAVALDSLGNETPVPLAEIGIPDSLGMHSPTTDFYWTAHACPDPEGTGATARLVVRLADHTASSAPITIHPNPWRTLAGGIGPGDETPRVPRAYEEFGARRTGGDDFRALRRSPLGPTVLLVDLATAADGRIDLFDLAGRHVRTLAARTFPAGATVVPWDGREESGAAARPGVYFARLNAGAFARTVRLVRVP